MDRKLAPAISSVGDFILPKPEKISVGQGKPSIVILPYNQTPVTKIEFVFAAGKIHEPIPGLAQFAINLLDKGTATKNAVEIANILDYHGAHLELIADSDFAYVTLYCVSKHVKTLLPWVIEILKDASFPEDELNRYRQIFIENLKVNLEKNAYLASIALRKSVFGTHPYGRSVGIDDAQQITKQQLTSFFQANFTLLNIFITGSIKKTDSDKLLSFCDEYKTPLEQGQKIPVAENSENQIIDGPGKDQASIRFGKTTLDRKHNDIVPLILLNHLLGGFFGSRLMKNIREEKGLTYGIYSSISHFRHSSLFTIGAEVNAQNTEKAMDEIRKEIGGLSHIDENEILIAKNHLVGSMQNDNASIFSISERIKTIELNHLSDSYYTNLIKGITDCSALDLIAIAKTEFSKPLCTVVVR